MLQAREKTDKNFHGAIPKLLHAIKHSHSKADLLDLDLNNVRHSINKHIYSTFFFF